MAGENEKHMDEVSKPSNSGDGSTSNPSQELKKNKNFNLEIKNFGPIKSGKISIKPLTIFVGPNQSGKSYAAMLIYSIYKAQERISKDESLMDTFYNLASSEEKDKINLLFRDLLEKKELELSTDIVQKVFSMTYQKAYEEKLTEEITRTFASPLKDLVFIQEGGKKIFSFKILDSNKDDSAEVTSVSCKGGALHVTEFPNYSVQISLKVSITEEDFSTKILNIVKKTLKKEFNDNNRELHAFDSETLQNELGFNPAYFLVVNAIRAIISHKYARCYYLPAARSGILQGHKALFTSIIRLAPYAGEDKIEIPRPCRNPET